MTERQRGLRTDLRERLERRRRRKPPKVKCKRLHRPPRVLLTLGQRADVSRANLKKATESRQSRRAKPESINTVWWLGKE